MTLQKLGEVIGKGGWGTVYQGWNQISGDFVAIKEVAIKNIPKEQLKGMMVCFWNFFRLLPNYSNCSVQLFLVRNNFTSNFKTSKNCTLYWLSKNRRLSLYSFRVCYKE